VIEREFTGRPPAPVHATIGMLVSLLPFEVFTPPTLAARARRRRSTERPPADRLAPTIRSIRRSSASELSERRMLTFANAVPESEDECPGEAGRA